MPALFSHARHPLASVAAVLACGLRAALLPRLMTVGEREFLALSSSIAAVSLPGGNDSRSLSRCVKKGGALDVGALYRLHQFGGVMAPFATFVWDGFAPSKAKFFAWLLVQSRIQSRVFLLKKHVLAEEEALCPVCAAPRETACHLVFHCPLAARFWTHIGVQFPSDAHVRNLHNYGPLVGVPSSGSATFLILCCWNLWKHRNGCAFRADRPSLARLLAMCREDATLWRHRAPPDVQRDTDCWDATLCAPR